MGGAYAMDNRKAAKKLRRKQALFLSEEPQLSVRFVDIPSQSLFIGNGGLQNGLSREVMAQLLGRKLQRLYMPVGKDYAFACFEAISSAVAAVKLLNGACVQEVCRERELLNLLSPPVAKGPPLHLYVCYVEKFPGDESSLTDEAASEVPPGLIIVPEFISCEEEACFTDFFSIDDRHEAACTAVTDGVTSVSKQAHSTVDSGVVPQASPNEPKGEGSGHDSEDISRKMESPSPEDISLHAAETRQPLTATLKHRRVMHYGYEFLYGSSNVDPNNPLPGGLPDVCIPLLERMVDSKLVLQMPDQLTVNEYSPGAGG